MKKVLMLAALTLSMSAFAGNNMLDYFKAVTNSDVLQSAVDQAQKEDWVLSGVENTMTYRCLGCFGFQATFKKHNSGTGKEQVRKQKLETSLDLASNQISVRLAQ